MNINRPPPGIPVTIIRDGKLAVGEIEQYKLDMNWIYQKLNEASVRDISTIFLAQADATGIIYIDPQNS
jgi:uncharacterized membrane protein YcaP (DUF421 family)